MEDVLESVQWDRSEPANSDVQTLAAETRAAVQSTSPPPATGSDTLMAQYTAEEAPILFNTHPAMRPTSEQDERTKIACIVSDPIHEAPGTRDAYVSYLITTTSTFPGFQKPEFRVRRRYNDFVMLHTALSNNYPASVVPPLPDKHASAYLKGGRFDAEFTARRCFSLNRFLHRCTLHPNLKRATELHTFLESPDWHAYTRTMHHTRRGTMDGASSSGMMDGLTDSLMGAFSKLAKTDKRFTDVRERSDKLSKDLATIEKLVGKLVRRETDVQADFDEMAGHFVKLAEIEPELDDAFRAFAKAMSGTALHVRDLRAHTDAAYLTSLRDQASYNTTLKQLLKLRDQKQLDFEALTEYQLKTTLERDQLASGQPHTNFIQHKVENLRGLNHDAVRKEKLRKLETKVHELQSEVESARLTSEAFDEEVVREVKIFESTKGVEMKASMRDFARANMDFYKSIIQEWESAGKRQEA
ncbi:PX domain-containing protein [Protomyces lactucae-debilis]|uniref:Sorting nexin-4 n=1 Tax=Protomyces lactucae-debilis TaxID=2754530 RepID=A0A1Y2FET1_PROLT|nr:PX domain-containing protein [Protomyces lactucae-debilis]ORY81914.1 PX domain-containing protein [Protomyces lactucae-debilis]